MAIFNTLRLRDLLVRGKVSEDVAAELLTEADQAIEVTLENYATNGRVDLALERVLRAMAEMEARLANQATQQARHINQAVGILLAALALAVGILLGFG